MSSTNPDPGADTYSVELSEVIKVLEVSNVVLYFCTAEGVGGFLTFLTSWVLKTITAAMIRQRPASIRITIGGK